MLINFLELNHCPHEKSKHEFMFNSLHGGNHLFSINLDKSNYFRSHPIIKKDDLNQKFLVVSVAGLVSELIR